MNPCSPASLCLGLLAVFAWVGFRIDAAVVHVKSDAVAGGNGTSWATAYSNLQDALLYSTSGDEVWVAAGMYYPDYGDAVFQGDRYESFNLKDGVALYGGFVGTETLRAQRNPTTNETVLSGEIGTMSDGSEDSIHVVFADAVGITTVLDGFTVIGGSAETGTGEYSQGGGIFIQDASPKITGVTFQDNQAYSGGAAYITGSTSAPVFSGCTFIDNSAFYDGGAVYSLNSNASFPNCTFSLNYALDGQGGGIFATGTGALLISYSTFSDNQAVYGGGGITASSASPSILSSSFSTNTCTSGSGGALEVDTGTPSITGCTFTANTTSYAGGALALWSASPTIQSCSFSSNQDSGQYGGGAVFSYLSGAIFSGCAFEGNFSNYGGAVYVIDGSPSFSNCAFSNNTQSDDTVTGGGGGIFNYNGTPTLYGCSFTYNSAKTGAGMYNYFSATKASNPALKGCMFSDNSTLASGQGGAIASWNAHPTIHSCTFTNNTANLGGALWHESTSVGGSLANCLFIGNSATNSGGAVYCPPYTVNCTFTGNQAAFGAAIYDTAGKSLANCILYGNTATTQGNPIGGTTLLISYSLVENGYTGTGNISFAPTFANASASDYSLAPGSPGIDTGNNASLPADLLDLDGDLDTSETLPLDRNGDDRVFNSLVDMGAYEYISLDIDNDGMLDSWEVQHGLDTDADDSGNDPDGDSYTNLQEYLLGTDPLDSSDRFASEEAVDQGNGDYLLSWGSIPGKGYIVQSSEDLTIWTDASSVLTATETITSTTVSITPGLSKAFFRVLLDQ